MNRRALFLWVGTPVLLGGLGGLLLLLLAYEPAAYRDAVAPIQRRAQLEAEFVKEAAALRDGFCSNNRDFYGHFTADQINTIGLKGLTDQMHFDGVSDPRVVFEDDCMRVGFRYRSGLINTVVFLSLRVWLTAAEPNVMILRLERVSAGLVPVSGQWLLERVSEFARQQNIEVNWYRHEGYPVAMIRFQADQARPTLELKAIQIKEGSITLHGRSRAMSNILKENLTPH